MLRNTQLPLKALGPPQYPAKRGRWLLPYTKAKKMTKGKEFKVGVVVKLKSGGPDMTVKEWSNYSSHYVCQWFAGKKLEEGAFQPESLEVVKLEPKVK